MFVDNSLEVESIEELSFAECQITITKAHLSSSSFIIEVHMHTGEVS